MNLSQITSKLSPRGWLAVGGSAAVAIAFVYLLMSLASAPSYTTLMAGINPAQTSKITSALSTAGIAYELQNNGTAIAVESGQVAQARVALAGGGLLDTSSTQPLASLSNQPLGSSDQQQNEAYQQALEQQLDGEIESMQGVTSAQVDLVIPNTTSQLFGNAEAASASVLLDDSGTFDTGSAKGIADLVAGAVQGLTDSHVTITDQSGAVLWPQSSTGAASGLLAKQSAQQAYDAQQEAKVDGMLAAMLGANKAQVSINADLNTNQTNLQSVTYLKKGIPLTTNAANETLTNKGGAISGANTLTGVGTSGSGNSNYSNKTSQTTWGVDKTVAQTQVSPGAINKQFISLTVDKSVPAAELAQLQNAVEAAAGYVKGRDTFASGQVSFVKLPVAAAPAATTQMIGYAKYVLIGIGTLAFLVFISRLLRKRETEGFVRGEPTWLRELEAPRPLAEVEAEQLEPGQIRQLRAPLNIAKKQVEDLVERDPDRVASQVRAWMAED
jgi:flagellar M-ring protein FliF